MLVRLASPADIPALQVLIPSSVRALQKDHYSDRQMDGAIGSVFGVDTQLIQDGTYYVAQVADGEGKPLIAGCGGWSKRKTLFGSDSVPGKDNAWLNPVTDAARIRAFFIHPDWPRRGIGSQILRACEAAARDAGFSRLELAATLPGVPLYKAHGYVEVEAFDVPLPNGEQLPIIRMEKMFPRLA
jgi:GNAT superfamily N-acetyltransferase